MPNDTLDEIEARWKDVDDNPAWEVICTLIEMVRARDRVVAWLDCLVEDARAALDTPPSGPEPLCEGGVPLATMGDVCPKCGAPDNDLCGYSDTPPAQEPSE